jgi:peptide-methionine (S)-S-oxide reductase
MMAQERDPESINTRTSNNNNNNSKTSMQRTRKIATIDWQLSPQDGFVPEPLFDATGVVQFVLGMGNFLPALHTLVDGMHVGDTVENALIDAGWGNRRNDLIITLPLSQLEKASQKYNSKVATKDLVVGKRVALSDSLSVEIIKIAGSTVTVDANSPLAGASYSCSLTLQDVQEVDLEQLHCGNDSTFGVATFALGCFWGAELAMMRVPGVVGTQVGYSQGRTPDPTYEQVCEGHTQHREVVHVIYNTHQVSYQRLLEVAIDRLKSTHSYTSSSWTQGLYASETERDYQYKHGLYYHTEEQKEMAKHMLQSEESYKQYRIEVLPAATFYPAEDHHQQYLYKGGQSTRKNAKELIRCFG